MRMEGLTRDGRNCFSLQFQDITHIMKNGTKWMDTTLTYTHTRAHTHTYTHTELALQINRLTVVYVRPHPSHWQVRTHRDVEWTAE